MASPAKAKPEGILGLSASEAKVLLLGFLCQQDQSKIDYEKLARQGGYTAGSASTMFRNAKRKLLELNPDNSTENGSSATGAGEASSSKSATTTPKKGQAKRKKAAAGAEDCGADGEEAATPTKPKRQRKAPAKKGAAAAAKAGADDGENGNGASEVKAEASKSEDMVKNEPMDEGNDGSEFTIKAELDEVMDDADLDAELEALDAAQRDVKAEDNTS